MSKHSDFHLIFFQIEGAWQDFTVVTKLIKNFKSLYGFGGRFLKIRDVCMDFEPYFKVHNLVSVHPKSIILGQMTNLDMVSYMVVSVYRLVKILKLAPVPWWISERLIAMITFRNIANKLFLPVKAFDPRSRLFLHYRFSGPSSQMFTDEAFFLVWSGHT